MKVILFGATGMIGQGVLRECLLDSEITEVLAVVRTPLDQRDPKLKERRHLDFHDFTSADFSGYDACLFCLGISSVGMSEADYTRTTYDITMAAAKQMPKAIVFEYISGAGTDGKAMWARVKKRLEDDLLAMFPNAYMFRPGFIQPLHGIKTKTSMYALFYIALSPLSFLFRRLPKIATTTEILGRAMLNVAKQGYSKRVLESEDINVAG